MRSLLPTRRDLFELAVMIAFLAVAFPFFHIVGEAIRQARIAP